jgi:hypothetical protein
VLDAGTIVGVATGTLAAGKVLPAQWGLNGTGATTGTYHFTSDDSEWGLPTSDVTDDHGFVKPIGVVYQPIYSFNLQQQFTNYKRTDNVGVVTDYVIQIPARTTQEHAITAGDLVMVGEQKTEYGRVGQLTSVDFLAGTFQAYDNAATSLPYVVGRCLKSFIYATGGTGGSTTYQADTATLTTTAAALAEFPGLDKVETVPGMKLSGSGTGGVPGHLLGGIADSSGNYRALTLLIRL